MHDFDVPEIETRLSGRNKLLLNLDSKRTDFNIKLVCQGKQKNISAIQKILAEIDSLIAFEYRP
jgi:hypothetical protein